MNRYRLPIFATSASLANCVVRPADADGFFSVAGPDEARLVAQGAVPAQGGTPGSAFAQVAGIKTVTAFPYTIVAADLGMVLRLLAGSAGTVNIPAGLGVGFHVGFIQAGVGVITFAAGSGATVANRQTFLETAGQHACGSVIAPGADFFVIAGDLVA